ncbi:transcription factor MYB41-like [Carya illinoinensis]|uniref:Uncharacterized protein n=1 Tax=Carya illinoinensis TaxID=32201 RepID=A0A8T1P0Q5_CARIL|nr:transcription factor MYB41-like [Carya illinoinensis]XP_042952059.1 transcription factor MYB41-like [Carya illinoinensis]KAG6634510.1 hypothetical protein CIPAW_12G123500 [Carya illinoinensis]
MGKSPCRDEREGLKKGPWTVEEDRKLLDYIQKHGHGRWRILPKNAGLKRCGKSCRLRWTNYLRPDIKRGRFSFEEEETIIQLHGVLGNKWSAIAAHLPGRTDNEIKNHWNTHIRKRLLGMGIDPVTHTPRLDLLELYSILSSSLYHSSQLNTFPSLLGVGPLGNPNLQGLATADHLLSSQYKTPEITSQYDPQQNQYHNTLVSNQFQSSHPIHELNTSTYATQVNQFHSAVQETQPCAASHTLSTPFGREPQLTQAKLEQLSPNLNFIRQNTLPNVWPSMGEQLNLARNDFPLQNVDSIIDPQFENEILQTRNNIDQQIPNYSFGSLIITTTSPSPTPLSSTTTYANCSSTEDERDSYCSNIMMFNMLAK